MTWKIEPDKNEKGKTAEGLKARATIATTTTLEEGSVRGIGR